MRLEEKESGGDGELGDERDECDLQEGGRKNRSLASGVGRTVGDC